jgi:hypothetical protein
LTLTDDSALDSSYEETLNFLEWGNLTPASFQRWLGFFSFGGLATHGIKLVRFAPPSDNLLMSHTSKPATNTVLNVRSGPIYA